MPNTPSAKKALRKNVVRRARNRAAKSAIRTEVKKALAAAQAGTAQAEAERRVAAGRLDRAAQRGIIHRNRAARIKSRLARQRAADPAAPAAPASS